MDNRNASGRSTPVFQVLVPNKNTPRSIWTTPVILTRISDYLPVPDLCNFAQVSRACRNAAYRDLLWETRLMNVNAQPEDSTSSSLSTSTNYNDPRTIFNGFRYDPRKPRLGCLRLFKALGLLFYDLLQNPGNPIVFRTFTDPVDQAKILGQLKRFSYIDPIEDGHDDNISKLNSTIDLFENAALSEFEKGLDETDDISISTAEGSGSSDSDGKRAMNFDRIKKYAEVLITLNGGDSCVQLFTQKHPLVFDQPKIKPLSFLDPESLKLRTHEFQKYLQGIADALNSESTKIDNIFSDTTPVIIPLFERVLEDNIMESISSIIEAVQHGPKKDKLPYLLVVPQLYTYLVWFRDQLKPSINSGPDFGKIAMSLIDDFYGIYIYGYLSDELDYFTDYSETEVTKWSQSISEEEAATESFLWSNVSKEKDKSDFLTSFKKVLMMPVTVISSSTSSGNNSNINSIKTQNKSTSSLPTIEGGDGDSSGTGISLSAGGALSSLPPSRQSMTSSPGPQYNNIIRNHTSTPIPPPSTELDAMMAVMNSKLESIKTLFSLELAVNLIRAGKESIERMGRFSNFGGEAKAGTQAKSQCESVFIELIHTLGERHVKGGFKKAIETLNIYNPKQHRKTVTGIEETGEEHAAVEPLAIFAELVNIGDLIQQMIHVFFEEELAHRKFVNRNDFLSPSVKAKKKFEQMLDEYVATGLSRGIDVLIDQIDFLFVTVQLGSDYNPLTTVSSGGGISSGFGGTGGDLGPTVAAQQVVTLLSSHMTLLVGSTEKSVLDVFQQEVGLRFFGSTCKHIKRQVISVEGAITLISDLNFYYNFILALRQRELVPYFAALKEVGQLFLIDGSDARALGATLSDMVRFRGVFKPEELLEFVECRSDWPQVKRQVEKVMYGFGVDCLMM